MNIETKLFKNNKSLASLLTFGFSAFWHGFYPVYYIVFFEFFLCERISESLELRYNIISKIEKKGMFSLSYILAKICFEVALKHIGLMFIMLDINIVFKFKRNIYFLPEIFIVVLYVYLYFILPKPKKAEGSLENVQVKSKVLKHQVEGSENDKKEK